MAILNMPVTSVDRIANEAVLQTILPKTKDKLSVVLRPSAAPPSLARLRRYMGEIYSQLWDVCTEEVHDFLDVCVYPANCPNTAPEALLDIQGDLQAVCAHDGIGWESQFAQGRGLEYQYAEGMGGLQAHVQALNRERIIRDLMPVQAVPVENWNSFTYASGEVIFVDDDPEEDMPFEEDERGILIGGAQLPFNQQLLYESVCVGGTFDGLHFGHRKLLTLAVSSVVPVTGRLLVGVTKDGMLKNKKLAEYMPGFEERCEGVRKFLHRLAPGMMNRVQLVPISDAFGPPGKNEQYFDALVLSHETLETGLALNQHRVETLGTNPLRLLCTRRTEAVGMSSTALRKMRAAEENARQERPTYS